MIKTSPDSAWEPPSSGFAGNPNAANARTASSPIAARHPHHRGPEPHYPQRPHPSSATTPASTSFHPPPQHPHQANKGGAPSATSSAADSPTIRRQNSLTLPPPTDPHNRSGNPFSPPHHAGYDQQQQRPPQNHAYQPGSRPPHPNAIDQRYPPPNERPYLPQSPSSATSSRPEPPRQGQPAVEYQARRPSMEAVPPSSSYGGHHTLEQHLRGAASSHHPPPPPPPPPPQTPHHPPQHLDTSMSGGYGPHSQPSSAPPYDSHYGGYGYEGQPPPGVQPMRRKAVRAAQACDNCRTKKAKCDEARPSCGNCEQNGVTCVYRDVPPPKQDRSMIQLTEQVGQLALRMGHVDRQLESFSQLMTDMLTRMESASKDSWFPDRKAPIPEPNYPSASPSTFQGPSRSSEQFRSPIEQTPKDTYSNSRYDLKMEEVESSDAQKFESVGGTLRPRGINSDGMQQDNLDEIRQRAHQDMLQGELAIPPVHMTAAHNLNQWSVIAPFFKGVANPDYVKRAEDKHILDLRPSKGAYVQSAPLSNNAMVGSPAAHSDRDDSSTLSNSSEGRPAMAYVYVNGYDGSRGPQPSPGGRNPNQSLSIDESTAWRLLESYFTNIHILIPFLNKPGTRETVRGFINRYCSEPFQSQSPFVVPNNYRSDSADSLNGAKRRKHSHGPTSEYANQKGTGTKLPIERSIENAIILLIFALGKISQHYDPLPPAVGEPGSSASFDVQSPPEYMQSPNHGYTPTSTPRFDSYSRSRRGSDEHQYNNNRNQNSWSQNIDRIPGLAYYAHAASILGELHGGNTLSHVQARLLAGLYMAQLVRVYDSWKWINAACISWLMLFKQHDDNPDTLTDPERLAYWACLISESDILAELEVIPSGLSKIEDIVSFPGIGDVSDYEEAELRKYYMAQVHIRKILNRAHSALYSVASTSSNGSSSSGTPSNEETNGHTRSDKRIRETGWSALNSEDLADQLEAWKSMLPPNLKWESDEQALTINGARLRAKYWGARNIIYRPFLHRAIHTNLVRGEDDASQEAYQLQFQKEKKTIEFAFRCIESVKHSTIAFDEVPSMPKRLIVTNIFGTAHAQFGNMLVLGAARQSLAVENQITLSEFNDLCFRTIRFLGTLAPLSPTMATDVRVLENMRRELNKDSHSLPGSANVSFQN